MGSSSPGILPTPPFLSQPPLNYYFDNIPPGWSYLALRKLFAKYLHVQSVFVSPKTNKAGRRFGFLKLHACPNTTKLENWLSSFWIGSYKLNFNKAKFNHRIFSTQQKKPPILPLPLHRPPSHVKVHRSYADVTKGCMDLQPSVHEPHNSTKPTSNVKTNPLPHKPSMIFSPNKDNLKWLSRCAIGVVSSPECIPSLHATFECEGVFDISVTPMGGNKVLLEFNSEEAMIYYVIDDPNWLSQWFETVTPWSTSSVANERFVWPKCRGVPAHIWCHEFFSSLACGFGKFVCTDEVTSLRRRLDFARILIRTTDRNLISITERVEVDKELFDILILEDLSCDFPPTRPLISHRSVSHSNTSENSDKVARTLGEECPSSTSPQNRLFSPASNPPPELGAASMEVENVAELVSKAAEVEPSFKNAEVDLHLCKVTATGSEVDAQMGSSEVDAEMVCSDVVGSDVEAEVGSDDVDVEVGNDVDVVVGNDVELVSTNKNNSISVPAHSNLGAPNATNVCTMVDSLGNLTTPSQNSGHSCSHFSKSLPPTPNPSLAHTISAPAPSIQDSPSHIPSTPPSAQAFSLDQAHEPSNISSPPRLCDLLSIKEFSNLTRLTRLKKRASKKNPSNPKSPFLPSFSPLLKPKKFKKIPPSTAPLTLVSSQQSPSQDPNPPFIASDEEIRRANSRNFKGITSSFDSEEVVQDAINEEALRTWEIGVLLGLTDNCNKEHTIAMFKDQIAKEDGTGTQPKC